MSARPVANPPGQPTLAAEQRTAGCLPEPAQILLLQAALGQGQNAAAAWERWERENGLDRPDEGSYRLLPLVYRNLSRQGYSGPQWNILRGIHRSAWSQNQLLFHQARPLLEQIQGAGVPVLLCKGAALALSIYPDAGCRPMRDIDILVPRSRGRAIFQQLEAALWRPTGWRPNSLPESYFQFTHAEDFEAPGGGRVDLHWHALNLCCHDAADETFWRHAEPLDFLGLPLQTCHATEHLLQACAHGIVWSPVPPVRWAADAIVLLGGSAAIDWQRLVETACRLEVAPYVHRALAFLRRELDAPVPADVLKRLLSAPVSAAVEAEFARESAPFAPRNAWQDLLSFYARWHRSLGGASALWNAGGFVRHLQYAFELESAWALPGLLVRSALRRLLAPRD
jgi:hypothetical protein